MQRLRLTLPRASPCTLKHCHHNVTHHTFATEVWSMLKTTMDHSHIKTSPLHFKYPWNMSTVHCILRLHSVCTSFTSLSNTTKLLFILSVILAQFLLTTTIPDNFCWLHFLCEWIFKENIFCRPLLCCWLYLNTDPGSIISIITVSYDTGCLLLITWKSKYYFQISDNWVFGDILNPTLLKWSG